MQWSDSDFCRMPVSCLSVVLGSYIKYNLDIELNQVNDTNQSTKESQETEIPNEMKSDVDEKQNNEDKS